MRDRVSIPIGSLAGLVLFLPGAAPLCATLELSFSGLAIALGLALLVLGYLLSMIEATVFSDGPGPVRPIHVAGAVVVAGVIGPVTAGIVGGQGAGTLEANLGAWFSGAAVEVLLLRMALTACAFMVTYCVVGSVAWQFVKPYYDNPDSPLRLRVPGGGEVILLQLIRGCLAVAALLPLLVSSSASGGNLAWRLAVFLAMTQGVIPLLAAGGWPVRLRWVHGIEIVVFAGVWAFAAVGILGLSTPLR